MRILSISNTPHDPNQGSGYAITGYVEGLRKRGHTVDAFGPKDYGTNVIRRGRRYRQMIEMAVFGLRTFTRSNYDLVELWGGPSWLLAVLLRWWAPQIPIVHHSNGIEQHYTELKQQSSAHTTENERWFQFDLSPLYDRGLRAADAIVTISSFDLPFLREKDYVPEERLYAIDDPLPDQFLDRSISHDRPKRIGYCGTWLPKKGIDVMRADLARFLREYPDWTFSVVGVGNTDVTAEFPADVRDQIEVTSFMPRTELVDWYHTLSIFVLPSVVESFGLVATEAMACGAALVATNVGYAHRLEHEREALILSDSQSPLLYQAVTRLAEDERFRQTIVENGYEAVQQLRWSEAVAKLESIYQSLVREKGTAASTGKK